MAGNSSMAVADHQAVIPALAVMLQKLDSSREPVDPQQYRLLSQRLARALADAVITTDIEQVLRSCPAAAEVYENLRYVHAGLCRSSLAAAVDAELRMRAVLARAAAR